MEKLNRYAGRVTTYHLIEGAKQARGLTVIIDVFRAFSLECYLYDMGVREIRPVGTIEEAFSIKTELSNSCLIGERYGRKCDGFEFGNSPSSIKKEKVKDKIMIHTTSSGTQGIVNAEGADEIITGSLVNAKAIAQYIIDSQPKEVSLVCMGNGGVRIAPEDDLCAEYLCSILKGREMSDIETRIQKLQKEGGEHFFDPMQQDVFPEKDFWMCIKRNLFSFVLRIEKDEIGMVARKVNV